MTDLRKDYFLERWSIVAPGRKARPRELKKEPDIPSKTCFFCPGNEHLTTPEIGRLGKPWQMRWFPNKYPAFETKGNPSVSKKGLLVHQAAYGKHEIIVETPTKKQLWDFNVQDMVTLLKVYNQRIQDLENKKHTKYVLVVKNQGHDAGASLIHSHTQVASLNLIPTALKAELSAYAKGKCNYCKVIDVEKKSARKCFENSSVVAFAPYASRFNYELWILPKRHVKRLSDFSEKELRDFAVILAKALKKIKKMGAAYNYYIHYAPAGSNLHFHLELTPRVEKWAGIELSSGITIINYSPEEAAKFYRSK